MSPRRGRVVTLSIIIIMVLVCGGAVGSSSSHSGNLTYPNVAWTSISSTSWTWPYYSAYYYTNDNTVRIVGYRTGGGGSGPQMDWQHPSSGKFWSVYAGGTQYYINDTQYASYRIRVAAEGGSVENPVHVTVYYMPVGTTPNNISGATNCLTWVVLQAKNATGAYTTIMSDETPDNYSFDIMNGLEYRLIFSNGAYYDFACAGSDVTFDYDACIFVYGYTCGIDTIKLYDDNSQLIETVYQASGYDIYEMQISDGQEYTISFYDLGIVLCYNQTFTCTGDHVNIDYDRCNWVYPPSPWDDPEPIYIWVGYDYNIVVFRDEHGNFIENSQLAIYDKTDNQYLQRWTDATDGYTLLGARFATDHDVLLSLRTFDGIFTLDTTYPANGSSEVGEENITTTNWTIPVKYNLNILPVDQYGMAMFDVFCGLSEYTPLNPGAFWGMDLSDRGYVPVTNCSGFSMCDIIAEKEGYADYKVEALNWTSKSALVKDYRHNIVMEEE